MNDMYKLSKSRNRNFISRIVRSASQITPSMLNHHKMKEKKHPGTLGGQKWMIFEKIVIFKFDLPKLPTKP